MKTFPKKSSFIKISASYGISAETAEQLFDAWSEEKSNNNRFNLTNLVYYFGGLLIIWAMTWFITANWNSLGGSGIALVGSLYMLLLGLLGHHLWKRHNLYMPGGLLVTVAVCITPLVVYGIEHALGWLPNRNGFFMEIATLTVGSIALYFIRFPFITVPIAFTLHSMLTDLANLLLGPYGFTYSQRWAVSLIFGLNMLLLAFFIDRKTKENYAFWVYILGLMAFLGGIESYTVGKNEAWQLAVGCTNLGLMIVSVFLQRKTFMVFGIFGFLKYLGHLAYKVFNGSMAFSFSLSLIGLLVIWLGTLYQRNQVTIENFLIGMLPDSIKNHLPIYRENRDF